MTWNEAGGTVSRAFDDWRHADVENRAFLRLSAQWSAAAYDRTWNEAEKSFNEVFDPDHHYGDEHVGIFEDAVDGLWPPSYDWMTEASVLKSGVTTFEVYLEKTVQEILAPYRGPLDGQDGHLALTTPKGHESPGWLTLVKAHAVLRNAVNTDEVKWARDLRHLLTHQNGELRTDKTLERFRDADAEKGTEEVDRSYVGGKVRLGNPRVLKTLESLASVVRAADPAVWRLVYGPGRGKDRKKAVEALYLAKCVVFIPD